jgi:hypothetical protein
LNDRIAALQQSCSKRACGTRAKYVAGCRCDLCRVANCKYAKRQSVLAATGRGNPLVPSDTVRAHLRWLSAQGIGLRAVAEAARVNRKILLAIRKGTRPHIRRQSEERVLAVDRSAISDKALVPAAASWRLLDELLRDGYSKVQLARWLGYPGDTPSLQFSREQITALNALRIELLYRDIRAGRLARPSGKEAA